MRSPLRVAVCADFREEGWPSMDRVADSLLTRLAEEHADAIRATRVCPPFRRRASLLSSGPRAANIDRGVNRLWDYPNHIRRLSSEFDVFHIVDHSYSQLVHALPPERTVVTCHDLDTFRSLLQPDLERRGRPFKAMTRRILSGLTQAAWVTCDTAAVRDELVAAGVLTGDHVVVVPVGVAAQFSAVPDPPADREADRLLGSDTGTVDLLHVGSTIARKGIPRVLQIVADVSRRLPNVRLVRVGGPFTEEQERLVAERHLQDRIRLLPSVDDRLLAAIYRRAAVLLLPSEREGFGLPVVEAMACGTPVVASDLTVLREVGGGVADHCAVGDTGAWTLAVLSLLRERAETPDRWDARRARGVTWARRFTWSRFADRLAELYLAVARTTDAVGTRESDACPA